MKLSGVFAAAPTPLKSSGDLDLSAFDRLLDLVVAAGVDGVCLGGATSEYPHFEPVDRLRLVERAGLRVPPDRTLLCAVGASSLRNSLELGRRALDAGCRVLLLPTPFYFRYDQDDLEAYLSFLGEQLEAPCLLYNLPDFTNGLEFETVVRLLRRERNLIGIKDSSGKTEHLSRFAAERGDQDWTLLVGDDSVFVEGLAAGWDGCISGVAGFCPELLVGIYRSVREGDEEGVRRYQSLLDPLLNRLGVFPVPWGVRAGLEVRGIPNGPLPLPPSTRRVGQLEDFRGWLEGWLKEVGVPTVEGTSVRPTVRQEYPGS